jgi:sugar phosphate isomerase/epimerase
MALPNGVKLGVSHLLWGFDMARTDRMVRFLDDASAIGFQGVLVFDISASAWFTRAAEFKRLLEDRKLQLAGVILRPGLDFLATHRLAEWAREVGGEVMVISGRCGTEAEWKIVLPIIERHAEIAAQHHLVGVYHHHTGWIAETFEQTERLLADTNPDKLKAMLDCGHATKDFKGHSAQEYFHRHHDRIKYVEFKDWSPETDLSTEVGAGRCDFPAVAGELKEHGYEGWIVVEQNGPQADPKACTTRSFRYITEKLFT